MKLTLGQRLIRLLSLTPSSATTTPLDMLQAQRMERAWVTHFFDDAKCQFKAAVEQGQEALSLMLGGSLCGPTSVNAGRALGVTHWRAGVSQVPTSNPHFAVWAAFVEWAQGEHLEVWFEPHQDARGNVTAQVLYARPDIPACLPQPTEPVVAQTVHVSPEVMEHFGSAQAYLDHLQHVAWLHYQTQGHL